MTNIKNLNINTFKINYDCNELDIHQAELNKLFSYNNFANKYGHRMRINLFYKLMKELIGEKVITNTNSALDIGCNSGYYSNMISQFGFKHVRGVDIDESLIARGKTYFESESVKLEVFNAEELNTNEKVDFILCTEVIEHTKNPEKVIENIKQVLNVNGVAVITLPNAFSLPYLFIRFVYTIKGKHKDGEYKDHLKYPFYRTLKLFKANHLEIVKVSGTNCFYLNFFEKLPLFNFFSKINFNLSYRWPFKYFSQFFFVVIKRTK